MTAEGWEPIEDDGQLIYWRRRLPERRWLAVVDYGFGWGWALRSHTTPAGRLLGSGSGYADAEAAKAAADAYIEVHQ